MSLDLSKLETKLDEALSNETSETLNKFLTDKTMSNNKQSSSIDWIINQVQDNMGDIPLDIQEIAKVMHKYEIIQAAYSNISGDEVDPMRKAENYYNETFGGNK